MSAPAGRHKQEDGRERYWDGQQWTEHYRSAAPETAAGTYRGTPEGARSTLREVGGPPSWVKYLGVGFLGVILGSATASVGNDSGTSGAATPASTVTATVTKTAHSAAPAAGTVTIEPTLPAETVTVTAAPAAPEAAFGEGVYIVGEDIEPGRYRTLEDVAGDCYGAILAAGTNGDDIISNDIVTGGRPTVVLEVGQEFESNRCGEWAKSE